MTALREAAQQALEALESLYLTLSPESVLAISLNRRITALRAALAEPVQQGCEHCNQPLYAAVKCRVCGRVTEPVAWIHTDPDKPNVKFLEWREEEPGYRGRWIKTPLYTARGNHVHS